MVSRLITSLMTMAFVAMFVLVPASVFAENAADAMNKLKEKASDIKAESSSSASSKADEANEAGSSDSSLKEKAQKTGKELLDKGKKLEK